MVKLAFVTSNDSKAAQLKKYLNLDIEQIRIDLPEIQSTNLAEIVEKKAKEAYSRTSLPTIVEDTSLVFNALGNLPGPLIKWFLQELGNEGLTKLLNGYSDRSAKAEVGYGFYDGNLYKFFSSGIEGRIALTPQGKADFGWDPIFIPIGENHSWAQIPEEERAKTSIRKNALTELEKFLNFHIK